MRNYQRTKRNPYLLPHNLYMRTLYIIKDYDRLKEEYRTILDASPPPPDGQPHGGQTTDPTASKALRLALVRDEIDAIEQALLCIPEEYRRGVWGNVQRGAWYPRDAGVRTYQEWKQRYVYAVAKKMKFI